MWIFSSVASFGMKNSIARKPASSHGSGRLVWGKASRGAGAARGVGFARGVDAAGGMDAVEDGAGERTERARSATAALLITYLRGRVCEQDAHRMLRIGTAAARSSSCPAEGAPA